MSTPKIEYPPVVSRERWLEARKKFLTLEKEMTRARDRLNSERRRLPMVLVDEPYEFDGPKGKLSLLDLFEGRHQLFVYHFMWLWEAGEPLDRGCPNCSGWVDELARGHFTHLHGRGTTLALISRAPLEKIQPFKASMGWHIPWYSSFNSRFNFDYHVSFDEKVAPIEYNYRTPAEHEKAGSAYYLQSQQPFDLHGLSCFLRKGDDVYHTYSSYGRGPESVGGSYYFSDLTALGRQEDWEEPKGRQTGLGAKAGSAGIVYPDQEQPEDGLGAEPKGSCCT
jgi:predicted dithiol-disulfide oxidoreductase (DUF899 family)